MITLTKYTNEYGLTQLSFKSDESDREALMTTFKGKRTWSITAKQEGSFRYYNLHNGKSDQMLRSDAERLARGFVECGRTSL